MVNAPSRFFGGSIHFIVSIVPQLRRLCRYFTTDTPAEAYSGIGFSAVKKTGSGKDSCA